MGRGANLFGDGAYGQAFTTRVRAMGISRFWRPAVLCLTRRLAVPARVSHIHMGHLPGIKGLTAPHLQELPLLLSALRM
jgi:hypothetical protein